MVSVTPAIRAQQTDIHNRAQMSVLYVVTEDPGFLTLNISHQDSTGAPNVCPHCRGFVGIHRQRWDNIQAALRSLACEGTGFRPEVDHFWVLSSKLVVVFHLQDWYAHLTKAKKKILTENIAICPC